MAGGGPDAPHPLAPGRDAREHTRQDTGAHLQGCAGIARGATGEGFGSGAQGGLGPEGGAGRAKWDRGWGKVNESLTAHRPSPGAGQGMLCGPQGGSGSPTISAQGGSRRAFRLCGCSSRRSHHPRAAA